MRRNTREEFISEVTGFLKANEFEQTNIETDKMLLSKLLKEFNCSGSKFQFGTRTFKRILLDIGAMDVRESTGNVLYVFGLRNKAATVNMKEEV